MELRIRPTAEGNGPALESLYRWLTQDRDLTRAAAIRLQPATEPPGTMGGAFDAIVAIVSNTIALGSLLVAYLSWRETQPTPPAVTIERDGVRVMLSDCTPETVAQVVTALGQAGDP